jgi:hypothetical protein
MGHLYSGMRAHSKKGSSRLNFKAHLLKKIRLFSDHFQVPRSSSCRRVSLLTLPSAAGLYAIVGRPSDMLEYFSSPLVNFVEQRWFVRNQLNTAGWKIESDNPLLINLAPVVSLRDQSDESLEVCSTRPCPFEGRVKCPGGNGQVR